MARIIFVILSTFSLNQAYASLITEVIIKDCYDGDTCTTIKGEKIRLACIDTPELKGPKAKPVEAKEAKEFLNNLVANKQISVRRITKDRYGRTVGELFKNGLNIQEMIVAKGHGKIYKKYSHQCNWTR
ncbi:MAG: thermonuclease family protein [Prochlorococcus marinus CUG1439]|uniref:thermonuclease family protein n=1 Tax=Prochlorococcus sp. MIT 1314 TaxID=3096220 RepID=UPI001B2C5588|nr:thermonuclease family protein [Prochlorococcus sp. MIT 1314]MCR8540475.1 thermonuclease family protein [Prochlorococcus marinus CUG1439]